MKAFEFWARLVPVITAIGAAFAWVYNWNATRFRTRIMHDLETLKLYRELHPSASSENDEYYRTIELRLNAMIIRGYGVRRVAVRSIAFTAWLFLLGIVNFLVPPSILNWAGGGLSLLAGVVRLIGHINVIRQPAPSVKPSLPK